MMVAMKDTQGLTIALLVSIAAHAVILASLGVWYVAAAPPPEKIITVDLEETAAAPFQASLYLQPPLTSPSDRTTLRHPAETDEDVVVLGSAESEKSPYLRTIRKRIEEKWIYPQASFEEREEGVVTIFFSISPSGQLLSRRINQSSGSKRLDEESLMVIQRTAPFPPFPRDMSLSRLNIIARFNYSLRFRR